MKHTIKGKHGHHFRMWRDNASPKGWRSATVCVSRSEAAHGDFMSMETELREKLSLKWDVCMWCWEPGPKQKLWGPPGKLLAKECGIGKCKAWGKPKKVNGLLTRTKKS